MKHQQRRALVWILGILAGLYLGYLALANLALNTGLVARAVNAAQQDVVLTFDSGWSVWPARVHLRKFGLRFEDANVQFAISAERLTVDFRWRDTLRRTIHATHVDGAGMTYWFRTKLDQLAGQEGRVAAFPRIAGYDPVPLRKPWPAATTPPDELWTLRIDDINAELRDIWMLEAHFKGLARASGSFELAPHRHLWVKDGVVTFEQGQMLFGASETVASSISGTVTGEYGEHNPDTLTTAQSLSRMTWSVELRLAIAELAFARHYFGSAVQVSGGAGPLVLALHTRDDALLADSRASYAFSRVTFGNAALETQLEGSVGLEVRDVSPRVELSIDAAALQLKAQAQTSLDLGGLHAVVDLAHARLDRTPEPSALDVRLESASTGSRDFKLASGLRLGGKARARVQAQSDATGRLSGDVKLELLSARLRAGQHALLAMVGKAQARIVTRQQRLAGGSLLDARLDVTNLVTQSGKAHVANWWLTLTTPRLDYVATPPSELDTTLTLRAKDGKPLLAALEQEGALPGIVGVLWSLDQLSAQARVQRSPQRLDVTIYDVKSESLGGQGRWRRERDHDLGVFVVKYGPFGVGLELDAAGLSVSPLSGKRWFEQRLRARFGSARGGADAEP